MGTPDYQKIKIDILIDEEVYDEFISTAERLEKSAKENKLGIWSDKE